MSATYRWDRRAARLSVLSLGAIQAYTFRYRLNPDGISYLDIADAYARGDWSAALNSYWSPGLSWLLAVARLPLDLSGRDELVFVHVFLFGCLAFALWAFERLMARFDGMHGRPGLWFGYSVFTWVAVGLIGLVWLTPDLLLLGILCLATAQGVELVRGRCQKSAALRFGLLLGVAYWVKAIALPLALVILVVAAVLCRRGRPGSGRIRMLVPGIAAFALTAAVWIIPLSIHRGHPTTGDAARLNAAWFMGTAPPYFPWQSTEPKPAAHPVGRAESIDAFAYGSVFPEATYPPWYAPSYWYEGVPVDVSASRIGRNIGLNMRRLLEILPIFLLIASSAVISILVVRKRAAMRPATALLIVPGLAGLLAYLLIHVEPRLVGPPLLLLWLGLLWAPVDGGSSMERTLKSVCIATTGLLVLLLLKDGATNLNRLRAGETPGRSHDVPLAEALIDRGLGPGDAVAIIGDGSAAAWARIARLRIVADMPDLDEFGELTGRERAGLFRFFADAGARGVVIEAPKGDLGTGWVTLGGSEAAYRALGARLSPGSQ